MTSLNQGGTLKARVQQSFGFVGGHSFQRSEKEKVHEVLWSTGRVTRAKISPSIRHLEAFFDKHRQRSDRFVGLEVR